LKTSVLFALFQVSVARGRAAESDQLCDQLKSQLQQVCLFSSLKFLSVHFFHLSLQADVKIRSLTDQNSRLVKTMSQLTMQADEQQQQIQHYASALVRHFFFSIFFFERIFCS
jgi:hypothetical protein